MNVKGECKCVKVEIYVCEKRIQVCVRIEMYACERRM